MILPPSIVQVGPSSCFGNNNSRDLHKSRLLSCSAQDLAAGTLGDRVSTKARMALKRGAFSNHILGL